MEAIDILDTIRPLTKEEVRERFGISRSTLDRMMKERRIPYYRLNKKPVFDGRQLKNWFAKKEIKAIA